METFKVAPAPIFQKIAKHPITQLALLILFVITGMSAYRIYQDKALQDRVAFFKENRFNHVQTSPPTEISSTTPPVSSTTPNPENPNNTPQADKNTVQTDNNSQANLATDKDHATPQPISARNEANPAVRTAAESLKNADAKAESSHRTPATATSQLNAPLKLKVHYIEVSKNIEAELKNLAEQESTFSESNDAYFGLVTRNFSKLNLSGTNILQQQNPIIENGKAKWFLGSVDPETNAAIGVTSTISNVNESADAEYSGDLNIAITTKDGADFNGEIIKKTIGSGFQLKKGQTFFVGGFFPQVGPISGHDWLKSSLMKVLLSRKFQENHTSVVIFFEINEDSQ